MQYVFQMIVLSRTSDDNNLDLFNDLKPEQRLVNILFDEMKLRGGMRCTGGHSVGYATNKQIEDTIIATSALAIESGCHHGGPSYAFRVHPVAKLNAEEQQGMLLEAISEIRSKGGDVVSLICDNAHVNARTFELMDVELEK